jgi:hypothetical protein
MRLVALKEALTPNRNPDVKPEAAWPRLTVRLHFNGVTERDSSRGQPVAASASAARAGQLVVSKIDARSGALGVVPPELDHALVSADFLLFDIAANVDPDYLFLYFATAAFRKACEQASQGSTNRRRLNQQRFMAIRIPLPAERAEQERIAGELRTRLETVDGASALAERARELVPDVYRSGLRHYFQTAESAEGDDAVEQLLRALSLEHPTTGKGGHHARPGVQEGQPEVPPFQLPAGFRWVQLGAAITLLVDCVHATPVFSERPTEYLGLKTTNVRPNELVLDERWYVDEAGWQRWTAPALPQPRDLILTREAPMGFVCQVPIEPKVCLTQRMVLLRTDPRYVLPEYLRHVINEPSFEHQTNALSRSAPPHLNVRDIPNLWIPLCGTRTQKSMVDAFESLWARRKLLEATVATRNRELLTLRRALINRALAPDGGQAADQALPSLVSA